MNKAIRDFIISNLLKALGVATGFSGYVYAFVLKYLYKLIYIFVRKEEIIVKEKIKEHKAVTDYQNEINKPGATADEIKQAGKDYLQN